MNTPRRLNGFQDRMRRDPVFREMLEALRRVYAASNAREYRECEQAVRTAIAKAEGHTNA